MITSAILYSMDSLHGLYTYISSLTILKRNVSLKGKTTVIFISSMCMCFGVWQCTPRLVEVNLIVPIEAVSFAKIDFNEKK